MKVTPEMKVRDALKINEKMLDAFVWLAPEFERLRNPRLRRVMSGRVSISQAARIARIPLTEALYLLNITAGESEKKLAIEFGLLARENFEYKKENAERKPSEIREIADSDARVHFVDVMQKADRGQDPMPEIIRSALPLKNTNDILLVRHPFDPIPLRDLFARRLKLASWAEERKPGEWYIYFYRPSASAATVVHPPVANSVYSMAVAA